MTSPNPFLLGQWPYIGPYLHWYIQSMNNREGFDIGMTEYVFQLINPVNQSTVQQIIVRRLPECGHIESNGWSST